jgi:ribosomal protein L32
MSDFLMSVHWRTCPKCGEHKFIGHGPLCLECFLAVSEEEGER